MGTNMNFKGFGNDIQANNSLLARQSSIYSLTFEELQNTIGGSGKDFGSMNMDELLKSIWTAEETQILAPATVAIGGQDGGGGGPLQRQGSLTLPRTLSQKTVDEVWKNISKEESSGGPNLPQRQQTLGEMTLEEFLFKAGVVREDAQLAAKPSTNGGYFGDLSRFGNAGGELGSFEFQQPTRGGGVGVMGGRVAENGLVVNPGSNLPLNANGVRSNQQQQQQLPQQQQQQQQQIYPKQQTLTYSTSPLPMGTNAQLGSPRLRGGIMGMGDQGLNGALVQSSGLGMVGLGAAGAVRVPTESPANQLSDGVGKSNGTDTSSVSPVPYVFNGGFRGRKGGPVEKVVERRQRRMIKNRESAARSRARKQAYTMELEAEVAKLKEENQELQKKQEQMMEIQKNQDMDIVNLQRGKKRCLRRTQTGPW